MVEKKCQSVAALFNSISAARFVQKKDHQRSEMEVVPRYQFYFTSYTVYSVHTADNVHTVYTCIDASNNAMVKYLLNSISAARSCKK